MKNRRWLFLTFLLLSLIFSGCSSSKEPISLDSFTEGAILTELPEFQPYKSIDLKSLDMESYTIITFSENKIYLSYRDRDENADFNIGYYDLDLEKLVPLYINKNISASNTIYVMKDNMYLSCYSNLDSYENPYLSQVIQISFNGDTKVLFESPCIGIGFFAVVDDKMLLKWGIQEKDVYIDKLTLIDPNSSVNFDIAESYYYYVNDEDITGERIFYASGYNNIIYFQRVSYKDESMYEEGTTSIIKYNIKKRTTEKVIGIDTKSIYISGSDNFIVLSKYEEDNLKTETGHFYNLKKKTFNKIPTVFTANFILKTLWISESKVIVKPFGRYIYCDLAKGAYSELKVSENNELVPVDDRTIMGLSIDGTRLDFYRID
ncbi:MAG: hypothetical protein WBI17_04860 [Clostridiaceae bacterium]